MIKIFTTKDEAIESIVEKIITSKDADIVVVIPKNAEIKKASSNFELMKREATGAGKSLLLESVDDEVLALAQANQIDAIHSLFKRDQFSRSLSDIVPAVGESPKRVTTKEKKGSGAKRAKKEIVVTPQEEISVPAELTPPIVSPQQLESQRQNDSSGPRTPWVPAVPEAPQAALSHDNSQQRPSKIKKIIVWGVGFFILCGVIMWVWAKFFGSAEIQVSFMKTPWTYEGDFYASTAISAIDETNLKLPLETFSATKNTVLLYSATGKKQVSQKAAGSITIWNAYSSEPQQLVATTRFQTPDGKIFRIDKAVTVPGAKVSNGKITPSSIEVSMTADKAGVDYNVGPVSHLTIPGFSGTPKYDGFYGEIVKPVMGGFVGEKAYPTDDEIAVAKQKTQEVLEDALKSGLITQAPQGFTILDQATDIKVVKLTVDVATDDQDKFKVFGESQANAVGFKEADLRELLRRVAPLVHPSDVLENVTISYKNVKPDFTKGEVRFSASAQTTITTGFDSDTFAKNIAGEKASEVRSSMLSLPGLLEAQIALRPFWSFHVPKNADRVHIIVQ